MKHICSSFLLLCLLYTQMQAQTPNKFNYQAVAKEANGTSITTLIDARFSILEGSATGAELYKEEHLAIQPDNHGLFTRQIGGGTPLNGSNWNNINWNNGAKFLKIEIKKGTGVYNEVGTAQQLVSVPYAQYSTESKGLDLPYFEQNDQANPSLQINNSQGDALKGVSSGGQKAGVRGEFYGSDGQGVAGYGSGANSAGVGAVNAAGTSASLATPTEAAHFNGKIEADNASLKVKNAGSSVYLGADPNAFLELTGGSPYIDFAQDASNDFDTRFILQGDKKMGYHGAGHVFYPANGRLEILNGGDQSGINVISGGNLSFFGFNGSGSLQILAPGYMDFHAPGGYVFYDSPIYAQSDNAEGPNMNVRNNANIAIRGEAGSTDAIVGVYTGNSGQTAVAGFANNANGHAFYGYNYGSGAGGFIGGKDFAGQFWGGAVRVDGSKVSDPITFAYYAKGTTTVVGVNFITTATGGSGAELSPYPVNYSLITTDRILAPEFNAYSDRRIKDIVGISNSHRDLEILNKIQITDYFFKDRVLHGEKPQKKVIGQQLAEVYPQAVSTNHEEIIPDIMKMASVAGGWVSLPGHTLKTGDKVQLVSETGKEIAEVMETSAEGFRVTTEKSGQVFVYGRQVSDFHVVDYEAIAMLNVSATQELARQVNDLKKQLAERDAQINDALSLLQTLRAEVNTLKTASAATPVANPEGK